MSVAPYVGGSPFSPGAFNEHVVVEFPTRTGRIGVAHIGIGENAHYSPGEQVAIVYNPANPTQAVFARAYTNIGSAGALFFFAIVLGFCACALAFGRLRMCRRGAHALLNPAKHMTATSRLLPRGRYQKWAITLDGESTQSVTFWSWIKRGCSLLQHPTEVTVYGDLTPRSVALVVDAGRSIVIGGWIPRRWREPKNVRRSAAP